jgi:hypothetical protein
MSAADLATSAASQQAVVEAALVLLERMGLTPADLAAVPRDRKTVPTFAEYVPVVSSSVTARTRRAYGSYWNRGLEHWGDRRLDEPTPSQIRQLMAYVKTHVVARRNARGGRSAEEHLVAALRCLYRQAERDGLIAEADNPARKVDKPRRLPSTRRAVADTALARLRRISGVQGIVEFRADPRLQVQGSPGALVSCAQLASAPGIGRCPAGAATAEVRGVRRHIGHARFLREQIDGATGG